MSTRQKPPRQNAGRAPIRKHAVPSVGTEPGFFDPEPPRRGQGARQAALYAARKQQRQANG